MNSPSEMPSHVLPVAEPAAASATSRLPYRRLDSSQVESQRAQYGANVLAPAPPEWPIGSAQAYHALT